MLSFLFLLNQIQTVENQRQSLVTLKRDGLKILAPSLVLTKLPVDADAFLFAVSVVYEVRHFADTSTVESQ